MASFPGAVKAFTSKNSGDVVQASHINDLQDEVNAIEDGYVNGTARLNSSNSTVARLSVSGVSTLAGAVTLGAGIASTASFASSVTFSSGVGFSTSVIFTARPTMPPPEMALVFTPSTVAISSALSTISFVADATLTNSSIHSTTTNPERLTPQSTGVYAFAGQVHIGAVSSNSVLELDILDSSGAIIGGNRFIHSLTVGVAPYQVVGFKQYDALGGFATMRINFAAQGSTISLSSGIQNTWCSMVKL